MNLTERSKAIDPVLKNGEPADGSLEQDRFEYASSTRRFFAYLLDALIVEVPFYFLMVLVSKIFMKEAGSIRPEVLSFFWTLMMVIVFFFYEFLFISSRLMSTPGKILLKLRISDVRGNRISLGRALNRTILKFINCVIAIGYISILFSKKNQTVYDMIADTIVWKKDL